jgi:hypothetical protein
MQYYYELPMQVLEYRTKLDADLADNAAPPDEGPEVKRARKLAEQFDFQGYLVQMASNQ